MRLGTNLHKRLQDYCRCYLEAEPEAELDALAKERVADDATQNPEEVALKYLALALLVSVKHRAARLGFGEGAFAYADGERWTDLPGVSEGIAEVAVGILRKIVDLGPEKTKGRLVLGMGEVQIEIDVEEEEPGGLLLTLTAFA